MGDMMATKTKRVKFPGPGGTKAKESLVMIDADRMLDLYNQDHPDQKKPAQRVTDKIVAHSVELAHKAGWDGTGVVKDAMTGHTSGLMLLRPKQTTINVEMAVVVAPAKEA